MSTHFEDYLSAPSTPTPSTPTTPSTPLQYYENTFHSSSTSEEEISISINESEVEKRAKEEKDVGEKVNNEEEEGGEDEEEFIEISPLVAKNNNKNKQKNKHENNNNNNKNNNHNNHHNNNNDDDKNFLDKFIRQTTNLEGGVGELLEPANMIKLPSQTAAAVTKKMKKDFTEMKEINKRVKWSDAAAKAKLPLLGIFLLLFECHKGIIRSCASYFIVLFILSIITFVLLITFWFVPQSIILQTFLDFDPAYSYIYSMYLVFVESSYIMLLISLVFSGRIQRTLFDIIFKMYNVKAKSMHEMSSSDKIKTIFIRISVPFLVLIITFPFNVIPFLGTFLWIIVYSLLNAWSIQSLYFSFKGLSIARQSRWISARYPEYICFGIPAVLLLSIPILSSIFFFTNIIGSAVWAVQLERNRLFRRFVRKESLRKQSLHKKKNNNNNDNDNNNDSDDNNVSKKKKEKRTNYSAIPTTASE